MSESPDRAEDLNPPKTTSDADADANSSYDDSSSIRSQGFLTLGPSPQPSTHPVDTNIAEDGELSNTVSPWVDAQPQFASYRNSLTISFRSGVSGWTMSSGAMSEYGAAWPDALDRTMNSGFGVGALRNKDRLMVRELKRPRRTQHLPLLITITIPPQTALHKRAAPRTRTHLESSMWTLQPSQVPQINTLQVFSQQ